MLADARVIKAVHESGHAAIALRFDIPVKWVTLDPPHLHRGRYRFTPRSVGAWKLAVMCLAGPAAEIMVCNTKGGGRIDEEMAAVGRPLGVFSHTPRL